MEYLIKLFSSQSLLLKIESTKLKISQKIGIIKLYGGTGVITCEYFSVHRKKYVDGSKHTIAVVDEIPQSGLAEAP